MVFVVFHNDKNDIFKAPEFLKFFFPPSNVEFQYKEI